METGKSAVPEIPFRQATAFWQLALLGLGGEKIARSGEQGGREGQAFSKIDSYKYIVYTSFIGNIVHGGLSPNLNEREIVLMTKYERAMLVIAILDLVINALALFKFFL